MLKRIALFVCTTSILSIAALAHASVSLPSGWYLEGNWGTTKQTGKSYPGVSAIKNTGTGGSINGGYKFMPFFAVEGGYTRYAAARLQSPVETVARDSHFAIDAAAKVILPISCSGFELFGKLGIAHINSQVGVIDANGAANYNLTFDTSSQSSTGLFGGGGLEYAITPSILANAQWTGLKGNTKTGNQQLLSIGLAYLLDPAYI